MHRGRGHEHSVGQMQVISFRIGTNLNINELARFLCESCQRTCQWAVTVPPKSKNNSSPSPHVLAIPLTSSVNSSIVSSASVRCLKLNGTFLLAASELAVRTAFLICRPLMLRSARV